MPVIFLDSKQNTLLVWRMMTFLNKHGLHAEMEKQKRAGVEKTILLVRKVKLKRKARK